MITKFCITCFIRVHYALLEDNFFMGSKYLLPDIQGGSKTNIPSSNYYGHVTAWL